MKVHRNKRKRYEREGYAGNVSIGDGVFLEIPRPQLENALSPTDSERRIRVKYQVQENCLTIFLPRELDHHNAEEIRKESDHLIERNHIRYVIFDFADTIFCDSSGIGVIMGRYKRIYMLGGEVCAVHTNERMRKMLVMSGVTKIMQIYEEEN